MIHFDRKNNNTIIMSQTQLEIQPRELSFVVELSKQSKCTIRLINRTDSCLAFKVKTTSPKKYCVRPNVGVIQPKATHEFVVLMQAPKPGPIDMACKDKFLIQSTIVPEGTAEEGITSEMFSKDSGRYIEESKLRVNLVLPPRSQSPELSAMNGTVKQKENLEPATEPINRSNEEAKVIESKIPRGEEEQKLYKEVEEMKSKLHELESKLGKTEVLISKLTEERRFAVQERESMQKQMASLRMRKVDRRVQDGFPLLFVCMVALISLVVGYGFNP